MEYKKICDECTKTATEISEIALKKAKTFDIFDFAMFKVCLLSIGTLIGAKFSKSVKKFAPFFVIIAVCSYAYLIYKMFFEEE